jgi:hypothetical protein
MNEHAAFATLRDSSQQNTVVTAASPAIQAATGTNKTGTPRPHTSLVGGRYRMAYG